MQALVSDWTNHLSITCHHSPSSTKKINSRTALSSAKPVGTSNSFQRDALSAALYWHYSSYANLRRCPEVISRWSSHPNHNCSCCWFNFCVFSHKPSKMVLQDHTITQLQLPHKETVTLTLTTLRLQLLQVDKRVLIGCKLDANTL